MLSIKYLMIFSFLIMSACAPPKENKPKTEDDKYVAIANLDAVSFYERFTYKVTGTCESGDLKSNHTYGHFQTEKISHGMPVTLYFSFMMKDDNKFSISYEEWEYQGGKYGQKLSSDRFEGTWTINRDKQIIFNGVGVGTAKKDESGEEVIALQFDYDGHFRKPLAFKTLFIKKQVVDYDVLDSRRCEKKN